MVFLIQNSQNRDSAAIQVKLDELIRTGAVQNSFVGIEHLSADSIVVQPVDQRPERGELLILDDCGVVERPNERPAALEFDQQPLVVDVEAQGLRSGMQVGAVDEESEPARDGRREHISACPTRSNALPHEVWLLVAEGGAGAASMLPLTRSAYARHVGSDACEGSFNRLGFQSV